MKREDLFEAIGALDASLLEETAAPVPKFAGLRRILPVGIAACLVIGAGALLIGNLPKRPAASTPLTQAEKIEQGIFIRYELEDVASENADFTPYIELNEIAAAFRMQLGAEEPLLSGAYTMERGIITLCPTDSIETYSLKVTSRTHSLTMTDSPPVYAGWHFTAELDPKMPFADAQLTGAAICDDGRTAQILHTLDDAEMAELREILGKLVIYQEDTPDPYGYLGDVYVTGTMYSLALYHEDGTVTDLQVNHTLILDGTSYIVDDESGLLLIDFIWKFREVIAEEERAKEEAAREQMQIEAERRLEAIMRQEEETRLAGEAALEYLGTGTHYRLCADSAEGYEDVSESALPLLTLSGAESGNPPRFRLILTDLDGHLTGSWQEDETGVHCTFDGGPEMQLVRKEGSQRLIMVSCPDHPELAGAVFTPEIDHWLPFSGLDAAQIEQITVTRLGETSVTLSEAQIAEVLALLKGVIVIQRDSAAVLYDTEAAFEITKKNGTVIKAAPASTGMKLDGKRYRIAWDSDADAALTAFLNALEGE